MISVDALVVILTIFGLLIVAAGFMGYAFAQYAKGESLLDGADRPFPPDTSEVLEEEERDVARDALAMALADDAEEPALKIDPEKPPTYKVYNAPPGKQAPFCNCHGRPIQRGENILMWPDPEDPGAYRLFHEDFVNSLGSASA